MNLRPQNHTISGPVITIRAIRITDEVTEAEFVRQLPPRSKSFRFLGGVKELTSRQVKQLCDVDVRELAKDIGMSARRDPDDTHQVLYSLAL
ncbi:hypothetical protein [Congregibacter sp.]|jgi:hypothetical protein|uniref:hypothetical protein n=1 Tax=Congregibacter sp. TaxID=2744308 RepID=UPI0039E2AB2A